MELTVVQRKNLAQFVHDAMEMEESIYTLGKMEEGLKSQQKHILADAEKKLKNAREKYKSAQFDSEFCSKSRWDGQHELYVSDVIWSGFVYFFKFLIPCSIFMAIVLVVIGESELADYFIPLGAALALIIGIIFAFTKEMSQLRWERRHADEEREKKSAKKKEVEERLRFAECNLSSATTNMEHASTVANVLGMQINTIHRNRNEISEKLSSLYSFGLIPPDYRQMDCVIMLNQIFRNGLADDMRSAILLYEERVRHGEIVRGLDKIASMIGRLSREMCEVTSRLERINENVCTMSRNLQMHNDALLRSNGKLLEEMRSNRQATQELIEQTAVGNYTSEQLLKSQEKILYYQRLQNEGTLPYVY